MTAKEYFKQAYFLDQQIATKLDQLRSWRELAERCTSIITGQSGNVANSDSVMENTVIQIVDAENELKIDIDRLIRLKKEIAETISTLQNDKFRTILEDRYLNYKSWSEIAEKMGYSTRSAYRLHDIALKKVDFPKSRQ